MTHVQDANTALGKAQSAVTKGDSRQTSATAISTLYGGAQAQAMVGLAYSILAMAESYAEAVAVYKQTHVP